MIDKEMLTEISDLMEEKLEPVYKRLDKLEKDIEFVRVNIIDNNIFPRLHSIEVDAKYNSVVQLVDTVMKNYDRTENRYKDTMGLIGEMRIDINNLNTTVTRHSQELMNLSV
ncbi:MAG: hypothetical protein NC433_04670 [Clostridiales bacterium]|nr:hypothetical protein [Clostridiales bacterium]